MDIIDLSIKLNLSIPPNDLVVLAEKAYDTVYYAQDTYLKFEEPEIHIWVEQGSVSYRTKVLIGLMAFYHVVSGIDGFVGGLEKIYNYSCKTIDYVSEALIDEKPNRVIEIKKSTGFTQKIRKVLQDVHNGKCSPDDATYKVIKLLEVEDDNPATKRRFIDSFNNAAKENYRSSSTQLKMFPDEEMILRDKVHKKRTLPKAPPVEASLQGVEIWYDIKTKRKVVRSYTK